MNEANVTIGKPKVGEADPQRGTVQVIVPLEGERPDEPYGILVDGPAGVTFYSDMPEMRFGNDVSRSLVHRTRSSGSYACA
jgi:hypothetical protein